MGLMLKIECTQSERDVIRVRETGPSQLLRVNSTPLRTGILGAFVSEDIKRYRDFSS